MSLRSVFEEICFQPASMEASSVQRFLGMPSLSIQIPTADAGRQFNQAVPFFSRRPPVKPADGMWAPMCGTLREFGIPLYAHISELEPVPVASVPVRFARRAADESFDMLELETAEAIEIMCRRSRAAVDQPMGQANVESLSTLPLELRAGDELSTLIEAVRQLSDYRTPIGCSFPAADVVSDVRTAVAAQVDFVLLEFPQREQIGSAYDEILLASVADAAAVIRSSPRSEIPLLVDAEVESVQAVIVLIAAGARSVAIDALLRNALPKAPTPSNSYSSMGLLGSLGSSASKPPAGTAAIESALKELSESLCVRLLQTGCKSVAELGPQHLRGLTSRAQELGRIAGLRSRSN